MQTLYRNFGLKYIEEYYKELCQVANNALVKHGDGDEDEDEDMAFELSAFENQKIREQIYPIFMENKEYSYLYEAKQYQLLCRSLEGLQFLFSKKAYDALLGQAIQQYALEIRARFDPDAKTDVWNDEQMAYCIAALASIESELSPQEIKNLKTSHVFNIKNKKLKSIILEKYKNFLNAKQLDLLKQDLFHLHL